jgi:hypothetical protein
LERRLVREGLSAYQSRVQQLLSVVATASVQINPDRSSPDAYVVTVNGGRPLQISVGTLAVTQSISASTENRLGTFHPRSYSHTLHDRHGMEIVAYHWHEATPNTPAFQHVHIGPALIGTDGMVRRGDAHKVHFPTGHVSLAEFVYLAISEFGIEPRRQDWETILGADQPTGLGGSSP